MGVLRQCSFSVFVRKDVFMYIFKDSGSSVSRRPGRFYQRNDFCSEFFCDDNFSFVNNHNQCVRVCFPVYMYSCVKIIKLSDNVCDFSELVYVKLLKEHC